VKKAQDFSDFMFSPPVSRKRVMSAFPDYSKGIISQRWRDPETSARMTAAGSGLTGAALAMLVARLMDADAKATALGGVIGAVAGGVPGYLSGRREAESENSRMLFLRRRLGINEPGEFEALLRHPERPLGVITKSKSQRLRDIEKERELESESEEKEAALSPRAVTGLLSAGAAGAGYLAGSEGTSRLAGYHDDPQARRISGMLGAITAGLMPSALRTKMAPQSRAKLLAAILGGGVSGELVPTAVKTMNTGSRAMSDLAKATSEGADRSLGGKIEDFLRSGTARGMGAGAGIAGLAALGTGLTRPRTDSEIREHRSRMGMVGRDMLKYVIPALAAGGALGSLASE